MRFIDNLNFLVHEIRIFFVVSVIWALVADNDNPLLLLDVRYTK